MKNKIYLMIFVSLMMIAFASATLGTFKQGDCVDIKTILNTSVVTLSTLSYPNGSIAVSNQNMTHLAGMTFNYTFCSTNVSGIYIYDYFDVGGNIYVNDFEVTYGGESLTIQTGMLYLATLVFF